VFGPAWSRIKEMQMANQNQLDAVEQLLIALLNTPEMNLVSSKVFQKAHAALMGSDGPPGTQQKTDAVNYLAHLKLQLK
jgi:hypothetical protein